MDDDVPFAHVVRWALDRLHEDAAGASPALLTLLLRGYAATGDPELLDALEPALAQAIDAAASASLEARPSWVTLFVEATVLSKDDRLSTALTALATSLAAQRFEDGETRHVCRSVDAIIAATTALPDDEAGRQLLRDAIHGLEAAIGPVYQPGHGVAPRPRNEGGVERALRDQIAASSALLSAYFMTARLPYAMLSEELLQFAKRRWWDEDAGVFVPLETDEDAVINCEAARQLCRLSALHRDPDYARAAVLAAGADYFADATRILGAFRAAQIGRAALVGAYGLALDEQLRLRANLQ